MSAQPAQLPPHLQLNGIARQIVLCFWFLCQVVFNILSPLGVFGGTDNAELSEKYPTPITPAGYTFAVWGLIYFCQAVFTIYQALPGQRESEKLDRISPFVSLAFALNSLWLVVFSYEYLWAALVVITSYLLSLLKVYLILDPYYFEPGSNTKDILCVWLGFSANLAWVTVATLLNLTISITTTFQVSSSETIEDWSIGLIFLAVFLCLYYSIVRVDPMYSAVSIWALVGISNGPYDPPKEFAIGGAVVVTALFLIGSAYVVLQRIYGPSVSTSMVDVSSGL